VHGLSTVAVDGKDEVDSVTLCNTMSLSVLTAVNVAATEVSADTTESDMTASVTFAAKLVTSFVTVSFKCSSDSAAFCVLHTPLSDTGHASSVKTLLFSL